MTYSNLSTQYLFTSDEFKWQSNFLLNNRDGFFEIYGSNFSEENLGAIGPPQQIYRLQSLESLVTDGFSLSTQDVSASPPGVDTITGEREEEVSPVTTALGIRPLKAEGLSPEDDTESNLVVQASSDGNSGESSSAEEQDSLLAPPDSEQLSEQLVEASEQPVELTSGIFTVGSTGTVQVDFLFDGGSYQSELALFSLSGIEAEPGTQEFIEEAARRALSNSEEGAIIISDPLEGAKISDGSFDRDENSGLYLGIKSFDLIPGDEVALMLLPNGNFEDFIKNPSVSESQKRPLFSLATANPEDDFNFGRIGDIDGNDRVFLMEDTREHESYFDRDFNDFIFKIQGVTADVPLLDEIIDPDKEWRNTPLGQQILELSTRPDRDREPPVLALELLNDTGRSDSDRVTSDFSLFGRVTDASALDSSTLKLGEREPLDLSDELDADGRFTLSADRLEELYGQPVADGRYTLTLQASDEEGNTAEPVVFEVLLDRASPDLSAAFDGLDESDSTKAEVATLNGQTEPGNVVVLRSTGETVVADDTGSFSFSSLSLALGENRFVVETSDAAGNHQQVELVALRREAEAEDRTAPTISIGLLDDTGVAGDLITSAPALQGQIDDDSAIVSLVARVNGGALSEAIDAVRADGSFVLSAELLAQMNGGSLSDGDLTVELQAVDDLGNLSDFVSYTFSLDTGAPTAIFGLASGFDTPPIGDGETTLDTVTLSGQTEAGVRVVLVSAGVEAIADDSGAFQFSGVELALGSNSFEIDVSDAAGNRRRVQQTVSRVEPAPVDASGPAIVVGLTNDTGRSSSDRLTSDAAVSGTVSDDREITSFVVRLNESTTLVEVSDRLDASGNFQFAAADLESLFGSLSDGANAVHFQAVDAAGNLSEPVRLDFTLDRSAPSANVGLDGDADPDGDGTTDRGTATLVGQTETGASVAWVESGRSVTADETGQFRFDDSAFALGNNPVTLRVTDDAGNQTELGQVFVRVEPVPVDRDAPTILASLANDTGVSNTDRLTADSTLVGRMTDENGITSATLEIDGQAPVDISADIDARGNFSLLPEQLDRLAGEKLPDGLHTLVFRATDASGNAAQPLTLELTLDTVSPELSAVFEGIDGAATDRETVTLTGQTDPNGTVTRLDTGDTVNADASGRFILTDLPLELGENAFALATTDEAGNRSQLQLTLERTERESPLLTLREVDSAGEAQFSSVWQGDVTVSESLPVLQLDLVDAGFDRADSLGINDALELALVDGTGRSLVKTFDINRDAFFNLTEGEPPSVASGAAFDGRYIRLDLSELPAGTEALLQVRLVNSDSDSGTEIQFRTFELTAPNSDNEFVTPLPEIQPPVESDGAAIDFTTLEPVTASVRPDYGRTSFNATTNVLYADVVLENTGTYGIGSSIVATLASASDPRVRLVDPDGVTPDGRPYYRFDGDLTPGQQSATATLAFHNPTGKQFDYELEFYAEVNQAPQIESLPSLEVLVGKDYRSTVAASDPNGDVLLYSIVEGPEGLAIDDKTGELTWAAVDISEGNHVLRLRVTDTHGAFAEESVTLGVVSPPPNRPPVFDSTPIVDANVSSEYVYTAVASDADGDALTYSLLGSVSGLAIDPDTGELTWTPEAEQLGLQDVAIRVDDGRGGVAEQVFQVLVGAEAGNRAPLFTSEPVTEFRIAGLPENGDGSGGEEPSDGETEILGEVDYVFVIDEPSGFRYGRAYDHSWLQETIATLDSTLQARGIDGRYALAAVQGGQTKIIELDRSSTSGSQPINLKLYDADGTILEPNLKNLIAGDFSQSSQFTIPADGRYTLDVRNSSSSKDDGIEYSFDFVALDSQIRSLSLGETLEGTLPIGEEVVFEFQANAGQTLYFDNLDTDWEDFQVELIGRTSTNLLREETSAPGADWYTGKPLQETGTYRLTLENQSPVESEYRFRLLDLLSHSDRDLALDTETSASLDTAGQALVYQFEGTAGQDVYFDGMPLHEVLSELEAAVPGPFPGRADGYYGLHFHHLRWSLFNPVGEVVESHVLHAEAKTPRLPISLGRDGTYTLVISPNFSEIDYRFAVYDNANSVLDIELGNTIEGSITSPGEIDSYQFFAEAGQILEFADNQQVDSSGTKLSSLNSSLVNLFSPSGAKPISDRGIGGTLNSQVLTETGTYRLLVGSSGRDKQGDYRMTLVDGGIDPSELASLVEQALPGFGVVVEGELSKSEKVVYTFEAAAGETIYFDGLADSTKSLDVQFWSPKGDLLTSEPRRFAPFASSPDPLLLPDSGTYSLVLKSRSNQLDSYQFKILNASSSPTVELDRPIRAEFDRDGETVLYPIEGRAGQTLYFENLPTTTGSELEWELYQQDPGIGIAAFTRIVSSRSSDIEQTLPTTGTYYLAVSGKAGETFDFEVRDVSPIVEPLVLNRETVVDIARPGEAQTYSLSARAGQKLYYDSFQRGGVDYIDISLLTPSGNTLLEADADIDRFFTLSETGTYELTFDAPSNNIGEEAFQLLEPQPLSEAASVSDNLSPYESAVYEVQVEPGQNVLINTSQPLETQIYDPLGKNVSSSGYTPIRNSRYFTAESAGSYTIVFKNRSSVNALEYTADISTSEVKYDTIAVDTVVSGSLENHGERDVLTFAAEAGQQARFLSLNADSSLSYTIYDPTGRWFSRGQIGNGSSNLLPDFKETGDYKIQISNGVGNYSFEIQVTDTAESDPAVLPVQSLEFGKSVSGSIAEAGERDIYSFTAEAGALLFYDNLLGNSEVNRALMTLVGPNGTRIADWSANKDFGEPRAQSIISLSQTGEYRLIVDGVSGATAEYEFQLLSNSATTEIVAGDAVSGRLDNGDETRLYAFEAKAGDRFLLQPNSERIFGTADEAIEQVVSLEIKNSTVESSDGYAGLDLALGQEFRPDAATNIVLVSLGLQGRAIWDTTRNKAELLERFESDEVRLNYIGIPRYDTPERAVDSEGVLDIYHPNHALGVDADGNAYWFESGEKGRFETTSGGRLIPSEVYEAAGFVYPPRPFSSTNPGAKIDDLYVDLAWQTGGSSWK